MATFNRIKDVAKVKAHIATIKKSERMTVNLLATIVPQMVEGVIAGDNVSIINQCLTALKGNRRKDIAYFVKAMLPHAYDKEKATFGKKLKSTQQQNAKIEKFEEFLESGISIWEWLAANTTHEVDETPLDQKVEKYLKGAINKGLTAQEILGILSRISEETDMRAPEQKARGEREVNPDHEHKGIPFQNAA